MVAAIISEIVGAGDDGKLSAAVSETEKGDGYIGGEYRAWKGDESGLV